MSLYNNVANAALGGFLTDSLMGVVVSPVLGSAADSITKSLGGGTLVTAVSNRVQNAAETAIRSTINKAIPTSLQINAGHGLSAIQNAINGNWEAALSDVLDTGLGVKLLNGSALGRIINNGNPNPLFGNISAKEARNIFMDVMATKFAKKNLYFLEVSSPISGQENKFNLFAIDVEYTPFQVEGDKLKVGGATIDTVTGNAPAELTITTLDDEAGSLKLWFARHFAAAVSKNGTVSEPGKYAIKIKINHHYIDGSHLGYTDIGLFRPESLSVSLSRRDDNLEELQMSFSQLDTFITP